MRRVIVQKRGASLRRVPLHHCAAKTADAESSGRRSAPLLVCKVHKMGNLFSHSTIVIDRAFLNPIRTHNRISCLLAATAAAPAVNLYRVHLRFVRHTPLARSAFEQHRTIPMDTLDGCFTASSSTRRSISATQSVASLSCYLEAPIASSSCIARNGGVLCNRGPYAAAFCSAEFSSRFCRTHCRQRFSASLRYRLCARRPPYDRSLHCLGHLGTAAESPIARFLRTLRRGFMPEKRIRLLFAFSQTCGLSFTTCSLTQ